jgi:hypothetical protein
MTEEQLRPGLRVRSKYSQYTGRIVKTQFPLVLVEYDEFYGSTSLALWTLAVNLILEKNAKTPHERNQELLRR